MQHVTVNEGKKITCEARLTVFCCFILSPESLFRKVFLFHASGIICYSLYDEIPIKILLDFFLLSVFGNQKPNRYLINPKSTEGLMKLLDTFLLSITCRGNIVLVSNSVEQYLGHCRVSLTSEMSLKNKSESREEEEILKTENITTCCLY
jgi:hypothetical protein